MNTVLGTFIFAIASALCPLMNMEMYLAIVSATVLGWGMWTVAAAAAAGQTVGKLVWYSMGTSSMRLGFVQKKMQTPRWQLQYRRIKVHHDNNRWSGFALLFCSATVGLPPLALMSVISGQLHFDRVMFCCVTFAGRVLRFAVIIGGMAWFAQQFGTSAVLPAWLPHLHVG